MRKDWKERCSEIRYAVTWCVLQSVKSFSSVVHVAFFFFLAHRFYAFVFPGRSMWTGGVP